MSISVWALVNPEVVEHMILTDEGNANELLFMIKGSLSHADFVMIAVTLWAIWSAC